MSYNQGDIVWLDMSFTDLSDSKLRPVLIISNDALNSFDDVVCLKMTKEFRNDGYSYQLSDEMITKAVSDNNTVVRFSHVETLDVHLLTKQKGVSKVKSPYLEEIIDKFKELIEL